MKQKYKTILAYSAILVLLMSSIGVNAEMSNNSEIQTTPDNFKEYLVFSQNSEIKLYDIYTESYVRNYTINSSADYIRPSPNGEYLAWHNDSNNDIGIMDTDGIILQQSVSEEPSAIMPDNNGEFYVTINNPFQDIHQLQYYSETGTIINTYTSGQNYGDLSVVNESNNTNVYLARLAGQYGNTGEITKINGNLTSTYWGYSIDAPIQVWVEPDTNNVFGTGGYSGDAAIIEVNSSGSLVNQYDYNNPGEIEFPISTHDNQNVYAYDPSDTNQIWILDSNLNNLDTRNNNINRAGIGVDEQGNAYVSANGQITQYNQSLNTEVILDVTGEISYSRIYDEYGSNSGSDGSTGVANTSLDLRIPKYMPLNSTVDYRVTEITNNSTYANVTANATVTSENSSVIQINSQNYTLESTSEVNNSSRIRITANYSDMSDSKDITTAPVAMEYIDILPPLFKTYAVAGNIVMQYMIFVIILGITITKIVNQYGGIGSMQLALIFGWVMGWVALGVMLLSAFFAIFIILNSDVSYEIQNQA